MFYVFILAALASLFNVAAINYNVINYNVINNKVSLSTKLTILHNYIQSPYANIIVANKVKKILFNKYKPLAYKMANDFHTKCNHVSKYDLEQGAVTGLCKAIQNYNTMYLFFPYARMYILQELYKTVTNSHIEFAS